MFAVMKKGNVAIIAAVLVVAIIIAIVLGVVLTKKKEDTSKSSISGSTASPSGSTAPPSGSTASPSGSTASPSGSTASPAVTTAKPENEAYQYTKAAVATDAAECSKIGSDILKKKGSAVDAAVASIFCAGVVNLHSTGIGGGGFMVIYDKQAKKAKIYNYRETAPANASERMYLKKGASSTHGGLSVGVPGEVLGLHTVWKKYGKLSWASLIEPSIKLMKGGFSLPHPLAMAMEKSQDKIRNDTGLRKLLMVNGELKKEGDILTNPELVKTFEIIKNNPFDFYNGTLAQQIVDDLSKSSGIITLKDLKDYAVNITDPILFKFKELELQSMPPPGSGAVLAMILNIIQGYPNKASELNNNAEAVKVFHRLIESFKWGYARRALLGDPSFVPIENITRALDQMMNRTVGDLIRKNKIKMHMTFNESYYGGYYGKNDFGTSHISVLAENGDAVSVTGTINYLFGSGYRSLKNGIIYNNNMDDFSTPGKPNLYGYMPTEANYIRPGKRPLSSMCPAIITDKNGDVKMIAGASGGSRIITGTAQVIINKLLFDLKLGPSVANPRVHHQLVPNQVEVYENVFVGKPIVNGLKAIGHIVKNETSYSVVQAIYKDSSSKIFAMSDPRKKGKPAGY